MNDLKLLIDANVAIDFLSNRHPFADDAQKIMVLCAKDGYQGIISAGEATSIFYVLRKKLGSASTKEHLKTLFRYLDVIDVTKADVSKAINSDMTDFEDAVIAFGAKRAKADYIITRDLKDFEKSPVTALPPKTFLEMVESGNLSS